MTCWVSIEDIWVDIRTTWVSGVCSGDIRDTNLIGWASAITLPQVQEDDILWIWEANQMCSYCAEDE